MRAFRTFTHSLLLLATLSLPLSSKESASTVQIQEGIFEKEFLSIPDLSFCDDVLRLMEDLESGELEKRCSPADFDRIKHFFIAMVRQGILPHEDSTSLEEEIEELLSEEENFCSARWNGEISLVPAIAHYGQEGLFLQTGFFSKTYKKVVKFVKNHKKGVIITAVAVVVGGAVIYIAVAGSTAAGTALATAAGAAAPALDEKLNAKEKKPAPAEKSKTKPPIVSAKRLLAETAHIEEAHEEELSSFAEELARQGLLEGSPFSQSPLGTSLSEELRSFASSLAEDAMAPNFENETLIWVRSPTTLKEGIAAGWEVPLLAEEFGFAPSEIAALQEMGTLEETVAANLEAFQAQDALGLYNKPENTLSISEFSLGFIQGLPKGMGNSLVGFGSLAYDALNHPIDTLWEAGRAFGLLSKLAFSGEWNDLGEFLVPEAYELVREWHTLPSNVQGERTGYVIGKYGTDILIPGAAAKAGAKGIKAAKALSKVSESFQAVEKGLILETAAGVKNSVAIGEVAIGSETLSSIANEITPPKVKKSPKEIFADNPALLESFEFFEKAEAFLKPFNKEYISETRARKLINHAGVTTFPRPKGVPKDFRVKITDKGVGMEYVHPENTHIRVRVMPGKPHSQNPYQQKPYVVQMRDGKAFDKFGNRVHSSAPEAHIPIKEFIYRN